MAKELIHTPALNNASSKHMFHARKEYKFRALSDVKPEHMRRFHDFWYDNNIFGKVDGHGNAIFPMNNGMSAIVAEEPHFALDFVKDAFTALAGYYEHAISKRRMRGLLGIIEDFTPQIAYEDPRGMHQSHLDNMKSLFLESYLYKFNNQIISFSDFVRFYDMFITNHVADFPMTLTGFILSNECPMRCSGLIIEVTKAEHDQDKPKNDILNSRDFNKYLAMATRFGFKLDKNAPWSLVADLSSPSMHKFMARYCIDGDPKNLFSAFYYPSYLKDLDHMIDFMLDCYYTLMTNQPYIVQRKICNGKLSKDKITRKVLMPEEINTRFPIEQRLGLYMKTRLLECGHNTFDSPEWQRILDKSTIIYKRIGPNHGLRYINDNIKKVDPRTSKFTKVPGSPPAGHTGPIPPVQENPPLTIGQTADYIENAIESGRLFSERDAAYRARMAREYVAAAEARFARYPALYTEQRRATDELVGRYSGGSGPEPALDPAPRMKVLFRKARVFSKY